MNIIKDDILMIRTLFRDQTRDKIEPMVTAFVWGILCNTPAYHVYANIYNFLEDERERR